MLKTLNIKNFALINQLEVEFGKGLNILTGETGAGKSILIDAIDLAFGARSSKEQIKTGETKALIELTLSLPETFPLNLLEENGIESEDNNTLTISREISFTGTRSRISGVIVTQNYVQELREYLIDIHSQHETYIYIQPKTHIDLLDNYGDINHQQLLESYTKTYSEHRQIKRELDFTLSQNQSVEQRIDFLKFQINEIESTTIESSTEFDELMKERSILLNSEELKELTYSSYVGLYGQEGSVIDILNDLKNRLIKASEFDNKLSEFAESISSNSINLKDIADELRNYSEKLETDRERLALIEERIDVLDKLKRKYGPTLEDVLNNLEKFSIELSELEFNNEKAENLSIQLGILEKELETASIELSNSRKNLAKLLSGLIQQELVKLEMPKVEFLIKVDSKSPQELVSGSHNPNTYTAKGINDVEFLISPNKGEPLKPLAKIASGGEISRVILAIKTIFARSDNVNTVIFDEIDAGISGRTSQAVAEELANLSKSHQVLCITHQPIIAAMADLYFYIEKVQNINSTGIKVNKLNDYEKILALSRLASGNIEQDSMNFAENLLRQANDYKMVCK